MTAVVVMADGGSRGNPGVAGCGALVIDDDGGVVRYAAERIGHATNNVAEYRGLVLALRLACEAGADVVSVRMDSKLVVNQMAGKWRIRDPILLACAEDARQLAEGFSEVTYTWIPREQNSQADALANDAMDNRPARNPEMLASKVEVRYVEPTGAKRASLPRGQRTNTPIGVRVQNLGQLAASLGLPEGPADVVAAQLLAEAPDEVARIFDTLPGLRYLTERIAASPLSWRHGRKMADVEAA